jgi:hypothetical protein
MPVHLISAMRLTHIHYLYRG